MPICSRSNRPANIVGTEYIAIKGNLNGPDKVFFIPTEPNTTLSVNGTAVTTLTNMTSIYAHTLYSSAAYYETNAPVYALHLTGFGCEVGGALSRLDALALRKWLSSAPPTNSSGSTLVPAG